MKRLLFILVLLSGAAACSDSGIYSEKRFPRRSVTVNGQTYNYRIYFPENRDPNAKVPVMLYLHGSNRRGDDNRSQLEDLAEVIDAQQERIGFIIVFPQCASETFWADDMMSQSMAALDQTVSEFNGDPRRLYLAGFSMGAYGTWQTAVTFPTKFAALVPVAGGIVPLGEVSAEDRALLSPAFTAAAAAPDPYRAVAEVLRATPVWIVHGAEDKSVPVEGARKIAAALKAAGDPHVNYVELEGVGHGSVIKAFSDPKLYEWLAERRNLNNNK